MTMLEILPIVAYLGCGVAIFAAAAGWQAAPALRWIVPALLGALFLVFSILTIATDGVLQFWVNHTTDLTGNQVWFDLIIATSIGFLLLAPRARAVDMRLLPWGIAVFATACIALLPMLARVVWLEEKGRR